MSPISCATALSCILPIAFYLADSNAIGPDPQYYFHIAWRCRCLPLSAGTKTRKEQEKVSMGTEKGTPNIYLPNISVVAIGLVAIVAVVLTKRKGEDILKRAERI